MGSNVLNFYGSTYTAMADTLTAKLVNGNVSIEAGELKTETVQEYLARAIYTVVGIASVFSKSTTVVGISISLDLLVKDVTQIENNHGLQSLVEDPMAISTEELLTLCGDVAGILAQLSQFGGETLGVFEWPLAIFSASYQLWSAYREYHSSEISAAIKNAVINNSLVSNGLPDAWSASDEVVDYITKRPDVAVTVLWLHSLAPTCDISIIKDVVDQASSLAYKDGTGVLNDPVAIFKAIDVLLLNGYVESTYKEAGTPLDPSSADSVGGYVSDVINKVNFLYYNYQGAFNLYSSSAVSLADIRNDFSCFLAVEKLTTFVLSAITDWAKNELTAVYGDLYEAWSSDNLLIQSDKKDDLIYSDQYLEDRLVMLKLIVQENANNTIGQVFNNDSDGMYVYVDVATGSKVVVTADVVSGQRHDIYFANDSAKPYSGTGQSDSLYGANGNDVLDGKGGDDYIEGMSGNDVLTGSDGNDHLVGDAGSDLLKGGQGNDTLSGGLGDDRELGGIGNDSISGGDDDDFLEGEDGYDTMSGGDGNDWLDGGGDADYLSGDIGDDKIYGGGGDDVLIGGKGNDILDGGDGSNRFSGGEGYDLYNILQGSGAQNIVDSDGKGNIVYGGKVLTGGGQYSTNVWKKDDVTYTITDEGSGRYQLSILIGSDVITVDSWKNGELGINLADLDAGNQSGSTPDRVIRGDQGYPSDGSAGNPQFDDLGNQINGPGTAANEDTLYGGGLNDSIVAGIGNDYVYAAEGNDTVEGDAGRDILLGGNGDDQIFADSVITIKTATENNDTQVGSGLQGEWLDGGSGNDTVVGGSESDALFGGAGEDYIIGGGGNDTIYANGSTQYVNKNWTISYVGYDGGYSSIVYRNGYYSYDSTDNNSADTIYGGTGDDIVIGGYSKSLIDGGAGNDSVWASSGDDTISGGDDDDQIIADSYVDSWGVRVIPPGGLGLVSGNDLVFGGQGNDSVSGCAGSDSLYGGSGDDTLKGDFSYITASEHAYDGQDYLSGGEGNDYLRGGGSKDVLYGGSDNDTIFGDFDSTDAIDNAAGAQDVLDGGDGDDSLIGGGSDDIENGGAGNDSIYGDGIYESDLDASIQGNDYLDGGTGNDLLVGGLGNDTLLGGGDGDTLIGDFDTYTTSSVVGNDQLDGGDGNDFIIGGVGLDTLIGGDGNDTIYGDMQDPSADTSNDGADSITAGVGDDQIFGGGGNDSISGGDDADQLQGNAGDDLLQGDDGADVLQGGEGNDTLEGGAGHDTMSGGGGDDLYLVSGGDVISADYEGANTIKLLNVSSAADLSLVLTVDGNYVLSSSGNDELTIDASVASSNFVFGDGTSLTWGALSALLLPDGTHAAASGSSHISGTGGSDYLLGDMTSQTLYGIAGNDTFVGNGGNDTLVGGGGNDTYIFNIGDGDDLIQDAGGIDIIKFGPGITKSNVSITTSEYVDGVGYSPIVTYSDESGYTVGNITVPGGFDGVIEFIEFDDGTTLSWSDALLELMGGAGNDSISGNDDANVLNGYGGDDYIIGNGGADTLKGGGGNDTLDGGTGHDTMGGDNGDDVYIVSDGDVICDDYIGSNTVKLLNINSAEDLSLTLNDDNRYIISSAGSVVLTIDASALYANFQFENGDVLSWQELTARSLPNGFAASVHVPVFSGGVGSDSITGDETSQMIYGVAGNDTLTGGAGNDSIFGGAGDDTYIFNVGDGDDTINDAGGTDTLKFGPGISEATVSIWSRYISGVGYSPILTYSDSSGTIVGNITILGGFAGVIENIVFDDGTVLSWSDAMSQLYAGSVDYSGAESGDTVYGSAQADHLYGYGGNDFLNGQGGNDSIYGYNGLDSLVGGDGSDQLDGGDDADFLSGGNGDDVLYGGADNDTLSGGTGSNYLSGDDGDDVYLVSGPGEADLISDTAGNNKLVFGEGISPNTLTVSQHTANDGTSYIDLTYVVDGESGTVSIKDGEYGSIQQFGFSDGTTWSYQDVLEKVNSLVIEGTSAADLIYGSSHDDSLSGAADSDTLYGGAGNDSLSGGAGDDVLDGGAGDDAMVGGTGNDLLKGGDGVDTYQFSYGLGQDTISDQGTNILAIQWGVDVQNMTQERVGDDLILAIAGGADQLTIKNYFAGGQDWTVVNQDGTSMSLDSFRASIGADYFGNYEAGVDSYKNALLNAYYSWAIVGGFQLQGDGTLNWENKYSSGAYTYVTTNALSIAWNPIVSDASEIDASFSISQQLISSATITQSGHTTYSYAYATQWMVPVVYAGASDNVISTSSSLVYAGDGNDTIYAQENYYSSGFVGAFLFGENGDDKIYGGQYSDTIVGGAGNDKIYGCDGTDVLVGGAGNDILEGGEGGDTYQFFTGDGNDTINELAVYSGSDRVVLPDEVDLDDIVVSAGDVVSLTGTENRYDVFVQGGYPYRGPVSGITQYATIVISWGTGQSIQVVLPHSDDTVGAGVETVQFSDGSTISFADLLSRFGLSSVSDPQDQNNYIVHQSEDGSIETILGGRGDDTIFADGWLDGGVGNDLLNGGDGADTLIGVQGADTFNGGAGDDVLGLSLADFWGSGNTYAGNAGSDTLYGTVNTDTYLFSLGDGNDIVTDNTTLDEWDSSYYAEFQYGGPGYAESLEIPDGVYADYTYVVSSDYIRDKDILKFGVGISAADINLTSSDGISLTFTLANGEDSITFGKWFDGTQHQLKSVQFADGTVWDADYLSAISLNDVSTQITDLVPSMGILPPGLYQNDISGTEGSDQLSAVYGVSTSIEGLGGDDAITGMNGDDSLYGGSGNDSLFGEEGDDLLLGSVGNDILVGGSGNDTYQFSLGDQQDSISDSSGNDVLSFGAGVNADHLWFSQNGNDLEISVVGTDDRLVVQGWYSSADNQIETIKSGDGLSLANSQVDALVSAMASFDPATAWQSIPLADDKNTLSAVIAANWH